MSALKHVILREKDPDPEQKKLDWDYIGWTQVFSPGVTDSSTQTDAGSVQHSGTQTNNPVLMHIDLTRTQSNLRLSPPPGDGGSIQFHRQAPGRISTSPTLRRMRSVRRPLLEEEGHSPLRRLKSPLAANALSDEELGPAGRTLAPCGRQRTRSCRSKTAENGVTPQSDRPLPSTELLLPDAVQDPGLSSVRLQERRRSSVVVSLPGSDVSPGDLFVSNGAAGLINDNKKTKWPFLRRSTTKGKLQTGSVSDLEKVLSQTEVQNWRRNHFQRLKDCSLAEFLREQSCEESAPCCPRSRKRQQAVWELFTSECVYFLDQLMVLKEVFLSTLSELQSRNSLTDVDAWRLFANLSELCLVSFAFLHNLLRVIKDVLQSPEGGGSTLPELLSKAFQESVCHSLQKYCLNYSTALLYLDSLKPREDFGSYMKWCERNEQCRRLQLRDLLVAPLQRLTRYPLLLRNIAKNCPAEEESAALQAVAEQVDTAICDLEGKVKWLENYHKVKQLRDALVWLPLWERDRRSVIPESLKHLLKTVTLENLITHRSLLHEGRMMLTENSKLLDVYVFLFDEFLLITKIKRNKKMRSTGPEQNPLRLPQNLELEQLLQEGSTFTVLDQPLSLDRVQLKNIDQINASASGLPHSFIIMHQNRYQQCIGAFVLQAASESVKKTWMSKIEGAVMALLKLDSEQPRVRTASLWLESSQI